MILAWPFHGNNNIRSNHENPRAQTFNRSKYVFWLLASFLGFETTMCCFLDVSVFFKNFHPHYFPLTCQKKYNFQNCVPRVRCLSFEWLNYYSVLFCTNSFSSLHYSIYKQHLQTYGYQIVRRGMSVLISVIFSVVYLTYFFNRFKICFC